MEEKLIPNKLSRRQFLLMSGQGAIALALLAGCGQTAQPAPSEELAADKSGDDEAKPAQALVTLLFLGWGDPVDLSAWDEFAAKYMDQNPQTNIDVTTVASPNDNHYPKLQTMIAGGTPPHVAFFQGWEWQAYADSGVMAPIDDYIARDNFTAPYPEGVDSFEVSTRRNGKRYLIPLDFGTMVMFYARQPFDEAGIDYPTDDWTMVEFLEIAEKITNTTGERKMFGLQANGSWFRDIHWIRSTGKQEFDKLVDPKTVQFNQPEIVEMIQLVASDVYHKLNISPTPADLEGGANTIETGNVAMKYEGPWFFPRLNSPELREQGKQVEFDVVLMPKGADESRPHRGWAEGVALLKSDNEDAAWDFAHFMGDTENAKRYSEITGRIPNTFELMDNFWIPLVEERFGVKNGRAFAESLKRSEVDVIGGVPRSKMWSEIVKPVGYDPLLGNSATAAEVLSKVDQELQEVLDEYWASIS